MPDGSTSVHAAPGADFRVPLSRALGTPPDSSDGRREKRARDDTAAARPNPRAQEGPTAEADRESANRPIRVMLVDDHRIVREGLAGILRAEEGIELVAEASDGRDAVERVERDEPDVVVMDVSMPRMDGEEATRLILRDHPNVRVIGLSMHNRADLANAMYDAGASDYLTKGGPASELIEAIRRHGGSQHAS